MAEKKYKELGKDYSFEEAYDAVIKNEKVLFAVFKASVITFFGFSVITIALSFIFTLWLLTLLIFWIPLGILSWKKYKLYKPKKNVQEQKE